MISIVFQSYVIGSAASYRRNITYMFQTWSNGSLILNDNIPGAVR